MIELVFEFPQGLPRRPRPGDLLKERFFQYEVISSKFWNNQYLVYARPVGLAYGWYFVQAVLVYLFKPVDKRS